MSYRSFRSYMSLSTNAVPWSRANRMRKTISSSLSGKATACGISRYTRSVGRVEHQRWRVEMNFTRQFFWQVFEIGGSKGGHSDYDSLAPNGRASTEMRTPNKIDRLIANNNIDGPMLFTILGQHVAFCLRGNLVLWFAGGQVEESKDL
jgi:hypothetical protein